MSAADPTAAVAAYLLEHIGTLVEGRVFRPTLPTDENAEMPRACVVIRAAGGYALYGGGTLPIGDPRMDIMCYGSTALESQNLAREALVALKNMERRLLEGCVLLSAQISAGPIPLVDPETHWPYCVVIAQVQHAEAAVG